MKAHVSYVLSTITKLFISEKVHGQVSPAHDPAAAQAVVDLVKKAKAELGIDADIDEELVRIYSVSSYFV